MPVDLTWGKMEIVLLCCSCRCGVGRRSGPVRASRPPPRPYRARSLPPLHPLAARNYLVGETRPLLYVHALVPAAFPRLYRISRMGFRILGTRAASFMISRYIDAGPSLPNLTGTRTDKEYSHLLLRIILLFI